MKLIHHYTRQIVNLRIQRMRLLSKPVIVHTDYATLEEISTTIAHYKQRIHDQKLEIDSLDAMKAVEPSFEDSRIFDL